MFGDLFSPSHLIVILFIVLLVVGPKKLPELAAGLGKGIRDFRHAMEGEKHPEATTVEAVPSEEPKA